MASFCCHKSTSADPEDSEGPSIRIAPIPLMCKTVCYATIPGDASRNLPGYSTPHSRVSSRCIAGEGVRHMPYHTL
jgi:hypothetical protein